MATSNAGPDPGDRRAELIYLTAKGRRNIDLPFGIVRQVKEELEHRLGERLLAQLHRALIAAIESTR